MKFKKDKEYAAHPYENIHFSIFDNIGLEMYEFRDYDYIIEHEDDEPTKKMKKKSDTKCMIINNELYCEEEKH